MTNVVACFTIKNNIYPVRQLDSMRAFWKSATDHDISSFKIWFVGSAEYDSAHVVWHYPDGLIESDRHVGKLAMSMCCKKCCKTPTYKLLIGIFCCTIYNLVALPRVMQGLLFSESAWSTVCMEHANKKQCSAWYALKQNIQRLHYA